MLSSYTLPGLTYADEMWMRRVLEEDRKRLEAIGAAWDAYYGVNQETLRPTAAERQTAGNKPSTDNVVMNFTQFIIDTSVFALFGDDLQFDLDADSRQRTPDEAWLDGMWLANRKMHFLQKLAQNGSVAGHAFVKIKPPVRGGQYPRLVNLSPEYVHVVCEPDDIDEVRRYIIQYPAIDPENGARLVVRQVIELGDNGRWTVRDQESRNDGAFRTLEEAVWPWPWPPIVDCQNLPAANEYYGRSDIQEHVVALQRSMNFILSNVQRIIKFHAHPKTWGSGFRKDDLRVAVDETIVLPGGGTLQNLEMAGDLASSLETYQRLREGLHEITQTPEVAAGKLENAGSLSGVALQILYGPLLAKTAVKRTLYGPLLDEIHRRTLEMAGRTIQPGQTTFHWPDVLPGDELSKRQAALIDEQLGVSQDTLLQQLGYDPDAEREKRASNAEAMADAMLGAFDRGESGDVELSDAE